jgi:dUTP pyrophosphatase
MNISFVLSRGAYLPVRGSAGSSGYDLIAPDDIVIRAHAIVVVHSGLSIELPDDTWECQVRGRSSMSKRGLWVANGTVDSDYRGVIGATVMNVTNTDQKISAGDRYAQIVFARVEHPLWIQVSDLTTTVRGTGGFGSTGR